MEVAALVACMAIIAQINAYPTESGSISHHNNEFDLPPMAKGGFDLTISVTVNANESISNKLKIIELSDTDPNTVPEMCKKNTIGKNICIVPDETLMDKSGDTESISYHDITIASHFDNSDTDTLILLVSLNGSFQIHSDIPLQDFEKLKHFSIGGIVNIRKMHFDFKH